MTEKNEAERGGFEPPVQLLTVQRFSKPPPSASRPPLQSTEPNAGVPRSFSIIAISPEIAVFSFKEQDEKRTAEQGRDHADRNLDGGE